MADPNDSGCSTDGWPSSPQPMRLILLPKAVKLWSYDGGALIPCIEWEMIALRGKTAIAAGRDQTKEKEFAQPLEHVSDYEYGCDFAHPVTRLRVRSSYRRSKRTLVPIVMPRREIPMEDLPHRRSVAIPDALLRDDSTELNPPNPTSCVPVPWRLEVRTTSHDGSAGNLPATAVDELRPFPGESVVAPWSKEIDDHRLYSEAPDSGNPGRRCQLPRMNRTLVERGRWFSGTVLRHLLHSDMFEVPTVQVKFQDGNTKWIPRVLVIPMPSEGPLPLRHWSRKLHAGWPSQTTREAVRTTLLCQIRLREGEEGAGEEGTTTLADIGELLKDEVLPFAMPPHWPKLLSAYEPSQNTRTAMDPS